MIQLIFSLVMMAICVVLYIVSHTYPVLSMQQGGGAGFYPSFLAAVLFFLMVIYLIENRKKIAVVFQKKPPMTPEQRQERLAQRRMLRPWWLFLALLALLPLSLKYLGFIVTGIWVILGAAIAIRWKEGKLSWKGVAWSALLAVSTTLIVYVVFVKVFVILLPTGELF